MKTDENPWEKFSEVSVTELEQRVRTAKWRNTKLTKYNKKYGDRVAMLQSLNN